MANPNILQITSGTTKFAYAGSSKYYYYKQLKQNISISNVNTDVSALLVHPRLRCVGVNKPVTSARHFASTFHLGLLPINLLLKTVKYEQNLLMTHAWYYCYKVLPYNSAKMLYLSSTLAKNNDKHISDKGIKNLVLGLQMTTHTRQNYVLTRKDACSDPFKPFAQRGLDLEGAPVCPVLIRQQNENDAEVTASASGSGNSLANTNTNTKRKPALGDVLIMAMLKQLTSTVNVSKGYYNKGFCFSAMLATERDDCNFIEQQQNVLSAPNTNTLLLQRTNGLVMDRFIKVIRRKQAEYRRLLEEQAKRMQKTGRIEQGLPGWHFDFDTLVATKQLDVSQETISSPNLKTFINQAFNTATGVHNVYLINSTLEKSQFNPENQSLNTRLWVAKKLNKSLGCKISKQGKCQFQTVLMFKICSSTGSPTFSPTDSIASTSSAEQLECNHGSKHHFKQTADLGLKEVKVPPTFVSIRM